MVNPAKIFLLEVGFIAHEEIGYSRTFDFDVEHLELGEDLTLDNLSGEINFSRSSEGILAQAEFSAFTETSCGRCLEKVYQPLESKFSELFTLSSRADKDTEMILPANGKIDFVPILRDYMLLEVPINSVCREDCQGFCPECGVNRNEESCNCATETRDTRLSVLKSLLDQDDH